MSVCICVLVLFFDQKFVLGFCTASRASLVIQWKESPLQKALMYGAYAINICREQGQVHEWGEIKLDLWEKLKLASYADFFNFMYIFKVLFMCVKMYTPSTIVHFFCFVFFCFVCFDNPDCAHGQELWDGVKPAQSDFSTLFYVSWMCKPFKKRNLHLHFLVFNQKKNTQSPLRASKMDVFLPKGEEGKRNEGQPYVILVSVPMEV